MLLEAGKAYFTKINPAFQSHVPPLRFLLCYQLAFWLSFDIIKSEDS